MQLLKKTVVWENHACMPLRTGDTSFLPQLNRARLSGINVISLNIYFDLMEPFEAVTLIATFRNWVSNNQDHFVIVDTVADIERAKAQDKLAIIFDIEGGNAVESHPGMVEIFYRLGVRWMLLAYNKNNKLAGGCMDVDSGLTDYGRLIIDEMERVGMVVCCSHAGYRSALEAIDYSKNPVIFSHSNAAGVFEHPRNIPDELLLACARSGGVINVNGIGLFLGLSLDGIGDNSTNALLNHIEYIATLVGPDHVGLGLDFVYDKSELEEYQRKNPESFPARSPGAYTLIEPERFPLIAEGLLDRGFSETHVQGVMGHNNLRVASQVWR